MKEKENCHYTESIVYLMEQVVVYFKIKGAQFCTQMNMGVTIDQFAILDALYTNGDVCQRDLSKIVLKDRSNTGRILNILEELGLTKRIAETKGKRLVKKVYLTDEGRKIVEDSHVKLKAGFHQIFDNVSSEEFKALRQTLDKLKSNLSETTSIQI